MKQRATAEKEPPERLSGLQDAFGTGLGASLIFQESEIMLAVLPSLIHRSVVALPLHDALMVPQSRRAVAKDTMEDVGGGWQEWNFRWS